MYLNTRMFTGTYTKNERHCFTILLSSVLKKKEINK